VIIVFPTDWHFELFIRKIPLADARCANTSSSRTVSKTACLREHQTNYSHSHLKNKICAQRWNTVVVWAILVQPWPKAAQSWYPHAPASTCLQKQAVIPRISVSVDSLSLRCSLRHVQPEASIRISLPTWYHMAHQKGLVCWGLLRNQR